MNGNVVFQKVFNLVFVYGVIEQLLFQNWQKRCVALLQEQPKEWNFCSAGTSFFCLFNGTEAIDGSPGDCNVREDPMP